MKDNRYKPKPNYLWSILSVSVVLTFVGIFFFFTMHSYDLIEKVKGSFEIVAELQPTVDDQERDRLVKFLRSDSIVAMSSVEFISKEAALAELGDEMGADLDVAGIANPLFDAVLFKLKPEYSSKAAVDLLKSRIPNESAVIAGMHFQGGLMDQIIANLERLKFVFLIAGIILVFLAMALIFNSIRLALYANRFLIKNMELVGASWNFIRAPFLKSSAKHGLISAFLTLVILAGLYFVLQSYVPELNDYLNVTYLLYLAGLVVLGGLLINTVSTFHVVTRYLSLRTRDLY